MKQTARGFTIVELLIVIVVIAILAVVTVIAYNGLQQRARNTQTISAVTTYLKALKLYAVDNGNIRDVFGPYSCFGDDSLYPADSAQPNNGTGQCGTMGGRTMTTYPAGMARLKPYLGGAVTFTPSKVWYQEIRGIAVVTFGWGGGQIIYILEGNVSCEAGFKKNYFGNTYCSADLADDGSIRPA